MLLSQASRLLFCRVWCTDVDDKIQEWKETVVAEGDVSLWPCLAFERECHVASPTNNSSTTHPGPHRPTGLQCHVVYEDLLQL